MQMKYKKGDFSSLPADSTGSTYDLICYKAEPTVGSPWGGEEPLSCTFTRNNVTDSKES